MKFLQILMVSAFLVGSVQVATAEDGVISGKHCEHKHSMQDVDTNKDGVVSREEFTAAHQARADKMFTMMDTNNDGKIDQAERQAGKEMMRKNCKMKDHKIDGASSQK